MNDLKNNVLLILELLIKHCLVFSVRMKLHAQKNQHYQITNCVLNNVNPRIVNGKHTVLKNTGTV